MVNQVNKTAKLVASAINQDSNELILVLNAPRAIYAIFRTFLGFRVYEMVDNRWFYFGLFSDNNVKFRPLKDLNCSEALDRIIWRNPSWVIAGDKIVALSGV
ncbi:MAG: hypothetical protein ACRCT1_06105 [Microcoleaceae cyanobacterium]